MSETYHENKINQPKETPDGQPDPSTDESEVLDSVKKGLTDQSLVMIDTARKCVSAGIAVTAALMVLLRRRRK